MKKRYTEEQIIQALKRLESDEDVKMLCRELGVHMQTIYLWRKKFGGMEVSDAKKLRALEAKNLKLKRMVADAMMTIEDLKLINSKNFNRYSDGTTHLKISGVEFVEKLASLVPPPRSHLTRFHGRLAPHAKMRVSLVKKTEFV